MTGRRQPIELIRDMRDAATKATEFLGGTALEEFRRDDKTCFAVIRAIEIIGEAAKRVPEEIRRLAPSIPRKSIAGIRDKLVHDYVSVNHEIVWRTVVEDIPQLIEQLDAVVAQLSPGDSGADIPSPS